MRTPYRTVSGEGNGRYEEKKSRFLSEVYPVTAESDVEPILCAVRKREYGANHHCYAYVIGEKSENKKCSDDGEPQKTAGMPMLSVLEKERLTNVLVVVSRYFGGTLLGTGGLVRAYESAAKDGLRNAGIEDSIPAVLTAVSTDYSDYQKLSRFFRDEEILVADSEFGDAVKVIAAISEEDAEAFSASVTELTQGRCKIERVRETWIRANEKGKRIA